MLTTTVVGSYSQPDWLIDKGVLRSQRVPRVRQPGLWRIGDENLDEAIRDATRLAVLDMEAAGIDIVTDGEIGRESYSNHFLTALDGVDIDNHGTVTDRKGRDIPAPRIVGKVSRRHFAERKAAENLLGCATAQTKITLPGPFTLAQQCDDQHYHDVGELAFAFAECLNAEARDLAAAGIDVVQFDEPWVRNDPAQARRFFNRLIDTTIKGISAKTAVHMCFGYGFLVPGAKQRSYEFLAELADCAIEQISIEAAQPDLDLGVLRELGGKDILLGVIDLSTSEVESVECIAGRIRAGLAYLDPMRLLPAPDCGMKYLPREAAFGKLSAMGQAAALVRHELAG
jgi:5-methyltetrahydropteroyltriglutamate--homocysteine methyltransferase